MLSSKEQIEHDDSSDPSKQSTLPSHKSNSDIQLPSEHWNRPFGHLEVCLIGSDMCTIVPEIGIRYNIMQYIFLITN